MKQLVAAAFAALVLVAASAAEAAGPVKVAFVDTGNTGRSVMAEAVANQIVAERHLPILVISRAVDLNPFYITPETNAASLLLARGLDVTGHRAAGLTEGDVRHADLIFTATEGHKAAILKAFPQAAGKVFTMSEYATGTSKDVDDAFGKPMEFYVKTLEQISGYLPAVLDKAAQTKPN